MRGSYRFLICTGYYPYETSTYGEAPSSHSKGMLAVIKVLPAPFLGTYEECEFDQEMI